MKRKWAWAAAAGVMIAAWAMGVAWDYFDRGSVAHTAIQAWLKLVGTSIYEYRSKTGNWPQKIDDLEQTSLPAQMRMWQETARPMQILWPKDLKPDPRDNAGVVLIYYGGGLFSRLGRRWVCWGDLRTEYMQDSDLQARLAEQKAQPR